MPQLDWIRRVLTPTASHHHKEKLVMFLAQSLFSYSWTYQNMPVCWPPVLNKLVAQLFTMSAPLSVENQSDDVNAHS